MKSITSVLFECLWISTTSMCFLNACEFPQPVCAFWMLVNFHNQCVLFECLWISTTSVCFLNACEFPQRVCAFWMLVNFHNQCVLFECLLISLTSVCFLNACEFPFLLYWELSFVLHSFFINNWFLHFAPNIV